MSQFNIRQILERNSIVPVVTIHSIQEVDDIVQNILSQGISCIEVTLRTACAYDAIALIKEKYGHQLDVGVGTVTKSNQLQTLSSLEVDFIVSPGLMEYMFDDLQAAKIPFIPGVVTPSEVMRGMAMGYDTFKLFPAELFGGLKLLKTYAGLFPSAKFCPTGGIKDSNYQDYLALSNVICVGGSWVV